jgi:hypothetical protein
MAAAVRRRGRATRASGADAIAVLSADHRKVERWFKQFSLTSDVDAREDLVAKTCYALRVHAAVEQELFYPAFLQIAAGQELHHEALIKHDLLATLTDEVEACDPTDAYFGAQVSVRAELLRLHVRAEERPGGMLAIAEQSGCMELQALGARLQLRINELSDGVGADAEETTHRGFDEVQTMLMPHQAVAQVRGFRARRATRRNGKAPWQKRRAPDLSVSSMTSRRRQLQVLRVGVGHDRPRS